MNLIVEWNNIMLDAIRAVGELPFSSPNHERGRPPSKAWSPARWGHLCGRTK